MNPLTVLRSLFKLGKSVTSGLPDDAAERDPIAFFGTWFVEAQRTGMLLPEAMTLATATSDGIPSARMVLLKGFGSDGFCFYGNYDSRKGIELENNPKAALVFHWWPLQRQVRIEGEVERLTQKESDPYFQSRPRGSRIGAWASLQSRELSSRAELEQRVKAARDRFAGKEVPLPDNWGGFRLQPIAVEFWQGRLHRLHDRLRFEKRDGAWHTVRLYP